MPYETTHRFLASELPVVEPESCLFHVLPVPLEATVSYAGGTARGPEAILEASDQLELWDGESVPAEAGIYTWPAVDTSGSPETVLGRVEAAVEGILGRNGLPVLLGGEHTVTYGALAALKKTVRDIRDHPVRRTRGFARQLRREPVEPRVRHAARGQGLGAAAGPVRRAGHVP